MARSDRLIDSVTIIDVAREAGVSYATVSRVINNKAHVKPDKREAVLQAMSRLGYTVNQQARGLASGRSRVIGLLVQNLGSSWMGAIIRGIDEELSAAGYDMMLYTTNRRKESEMAYASAITRGVADGLLLIIPREPQAYLESLHRQHFPYVLIDHQGIDDQGAAVAVRNWQGAYAATTYLIELGHRRIGFITGNIEMHSAMERLAGYQAALIDHDIPLAPELVVEGDFVQATGFVRGHTLLSLPQRPTAIFASNDVMAFGVIDAARDRGMRVPEDLSVVGFDDIAEAATIYPALTTVRQPLEQMGRTATQMLLRLIESPSTPAERIILPTELIIRKSCQPPRDS